MATVAELLAELVAFPTQQAGGEGGGGNELALCEHLAPKLRALGADEVIVEVSARSDGSAGAYVFARWGTPRRLINAHVDTVPANAGWTRSPWQPQIANGKLYGLGSCDTKAAIAAILIALEATRAQDLAVLFSGDEEAGSAIMHRFLASPHARGIEQAIVCEPTARTAGVAHRGVLAHAATLEGAGGHSSKADFMPKPIATLARLAVALDDLGVRYLHEGPPGMTGLCMNVAALHGGMAFNVVPQRGRLEWSTRPYPSFDRTAYTAELAKLAAAIDPAIVLSVMVDHAPFECANAEALSALVKPFVTSIGKLDFWTEAALYMEHGIHAIVIGPGDIAQAHSADEFVSLEDLDWGVELFRTLARA
jgi:acetylornithine deacetylase